MLDSWRSLKNISTLQVLYLQNNPIKNILYSSGDFPRLRMLNIQDSRIQDWGDVHSLNLFPSLTEIRIKNVPILENIDDVQATLTARLGKIKVLNGSKLSDRRRLDAELWYLNQSYKEKDTPNFDQIHPRYQELVNIHGEPVAVPLELSSNILKDRLLTINIKYENQTIQKKFTSTVKVRSLKALISKLFRISLPSIQIYLIQDEGDMELEDEWKDLAWYDVKNGSEIKLLKIS